jgi:GTPase SAR1 family protein
MIIAFDLTNRKSFESVRAWIDSIYRHSTDTSLPKVLVGNKVDLADANSRELRAVLKSEALKLASEHDITYFETSAKENINIAEVMQHIMGKVYTNLFKNTIDE